MRFCRHNAVLPTNLAESNKTAGHTSERRYSVSRTGADALS